MNFYTDKYWLMQGDCLELMKNIPDGSVDLVLTDPPYLCGYSRHDRKSRFSKKIANDENNSANEGMIKKYLQECYRIMKDNTPIYCFCNYKKSTFSNNKLKLQDLISKTL